MRRLFASVAGIDVGLLVESPKVRQLSLPNELLHQNWREFVEFDKYDRLFAHHEFSSHLLFQIKSESYLQAEIVTTKGNADSIIRRVCSLRSWMWKLKDG